MLPRPAPAPLRPGRVDRRTLLRVATGAGGLGLVAAGCGSDEPAPGPARRPGEPDAALVDRVRTLVGARLAEVVAVRSRVPALRVPLLPLQELHRAHLAALAGSPATPPGAAPDPASGGAARARSRLRRREADHSRLLREAALESRSGALARLLASMAGGVGAHAGALAGGAPPPVVAPPGPAPTSEPEPEPTIAAWQDVLAAEHAAVYVLGVLGARTSQTTSPELLEQVRSAYVEHRGRRDDLIGQVAAAGGLPRAAVTAYAAPQGLDSPVGITAAATALEQATATSYAALVADSTGSARAQAVGWLADSAIRVLALRGTPEMFPGAGEYADR